MSFFATIEGQLTYPDSSSFDEMVKKLEPWMDKEGFFLDELGNRLCEESNICRELKSIEIPCFHYKNLSRIDFFLGGNSVKGYVVMTSTDGCFTGWHIVDGVQQQYDLAKWAKENMEENNTPPKRKKKESDQEYFQRLNDWQGEVEQEFICEFV